jgi:uncharacterized protein (TIGR03435 family)
VPSTPEKETNVKMLVPLLMVALAAPIHAQPSFEVASVKPSNSSTQPSANFPLGPGDVYTPNGGYFTATAMPLITYIFFAYKIMGNKGRYLTQQLPSWVMSDRFDIQARAAGNPGKDDMRMMMRSLLAERFNLAIHHENREVPVLAMVLAKPGKLGPHLQKHPADTPCPTTPDKDADLGPKLQTVEGGFPALCNGLFPLTAGETGHIKAGARNVTLAFMADSLSGFTNADRPIIDKTGIDDRVDFTLEWAVERRGPPQPGAEAQLSLPSGPTFEQALREQLGLKLESQKGSVDVIVVDHIDHPSPN